MVFLCLVICKQIGCPLCTALCHCAVLLLLTSRAVPAAGDNLGLVAQCHQGKEKVAAVPTAVALLALGRSSFLY